MQNAVWSGKKEVLPVVCEHFLGQREAEAEAAKKDTGLRTSGH